MNRSVKVIVSVVVCVWLFAMGLELGAYRERKNYNSAIGTNTQIQTQQPVTQTPVTQQPATQGTTALSTSAQATEKSDSANTTKKQSGDDTTKKQDNGETEKQDGDSSVPQGNEAIAEAFNKAMNATKHATQNCNVSKDTDVKVNVTDCSVSAATSLVNKVVQGFVGAEHTDYAFVNGVATTSDGASVNMNDELPPSARDCALTAAGIQTATAEAAADGGYTLNITLVSETSSLGNEPTVHANSVGYLDLNSLDISAVTITGADFTYPGANVIITVNKDGLVTDYKCVLPMSGTGTGKASFITASATLEGSLTETWKLTWA